jgi:hypothetical protein
MKYNIPQDRLNSIIKKFILKSYSEIHDVMFKNKKVFLASNKDQKTITENVIIIIIDNSKNEMDKWELKDLVNEIIGNVENMFELNHLSYGSGWSFKVHQLAIVNLDSQIIEL